MLWIYDESSRNPNVHYQLAMLSDWYVIRFVHAAEDAS